MEESLPLEVEALVIEAACNVEAIEGNDKCKLNSPKKCNKDHRLRTALTTFSFGILIVSSLVVAVISFSLWLRFERIKELTNMYPTFFGFIIAAAINILGSFAGLSSLNDVAEDGIDFEARSHYIAVICLLLSGMIFNIVFPTSGLMPFRVDSETRIKTTPLSECFNDLAKPQCFDASKVKTAIYMMYIMIPIEITVIAVYYFIWMRRDEPQSKMCINKLHQKLKNQNKTEKANIQPVIKDTNTKKESILNVDNK